MDTYPFNSLPMEMKEMVLEKVNPDASQKLLKVNRQLRKYFLHHGPVYKKEVDVLSILLSAQHGLIFLDPIYPRCTNSRYFLSNRSGISINVPPADKQEENDLLTILRFLRTIRSTREISLELNDQEDVVFFEGHFKEILHRFPILFRYKLQVGFYASVFTGLELYQPRIRDYFDLKIRNGLGCSSDETIQIFASLKTMLADCQHFRMEGDTNFLLELLPELNVKQVVIELDWYRWSTVRLFTASIRRTIAEGIPGLNPRAEICYCVRSCYCEGIDFDVLRAIFTDDPSIEEVDKWKYYCHFEELAQHFTRHGTITAYETKEPKRMAFIVHQTGCGEAYHHFYARKL